MEEHHIAGICVFVVGFLGATTNYIVVLFSGRIPALDNPFGQLTKSQALAEAVHLSIFTLYFAPTVFFDLEFMKTDQVSRVFGHICLICYDICIYSHLTASINRLTAIYFPMSYGAIFTKERTRYMIVLCWFLAITPTFYAYIYADCRFVYSDTFWTFTFTSTEICIFITWYTDFMKYVTIVIIIVLLDIATFAKVRFSYRFIKQEDKVLRKRRHDEINFVKQVCMQGCVFVCELLTYFVIVGYAENKWAKFFLTTIAWELVHSLDGVIIITFNKGFHRHFAKMLSNRVSTVVKSTQYHENSHSHSGVSNVVTPKRTVESH